MLRWGAAAYAILSLGVIAVCWWWLGRLPFVHPEPWLTLSSPLDHAYSLLVGVAVGGVLVVSSRICVGRFRWAQRLHQEFRPVARQLSAAGVVTLASLSAIGEELLFRGLLQPELGLLPQALLFGFAHQMPGPSRWVWSLWACAVGLLLGVVFALTGSVLGPIVAHALVNGLNLLYLKHHDLSQKPPLGGLLGRRSG